MWYQKSMEELEADLLQAHRAVLLVVKQKDALVAENARLRTALEGCRHSILHMARDFSPDQVYESILRQIADALGENAAP